MHFLIRKIILDIDYDAANEARRSHFHKLFGRLCWKENWQKEDENYFQMRRDSCVIEKCELITRKIWYENAWIDNYGWAILLTTNCPSVVNNKLSVLRNYCFPWRFPFWNARQHLLNTKITCLRRGDRVDISVSCRTKWAEIKLRLKIPTWNWIGVAHLRPTRIASSRHQPMGLQPTLIMGWATSCTGNERQNRYYFAFISDRES